jgi:xanthine dehydrogenase YagR molybdenum-binding subunit
MSMNVGATLMGELAVDEKRGLFVDHDLANYEVSIRADILHQDAIFLDEANAISSPKKAKGSASSASAALGLRSRTPSTAPPASGRATNPVTLDKLIDHMPDAA